MTASPNPVGRRGAMIGIVAVLMLGSAGMGYALRPAPPEPLVLATIAPTATLRPSPVPTIAPTTTPAPMTVYVSGEVRKPGVYTLPVGSRIVDAISAAGGVTVKADGAALNQAQVVQDGMQIHIPARGTASPPPPISQTVAATQPASVPTVPGLININTADATLLETLPGIGPTLAADIIAYRTQNGPFTTLEELMNVPGIGEGRYADLEGLITVQ